MNAKTTLVLVALIGAGLFALPQTTALFAGQHSFTNIDATGNQIDCVKCHGDVNTELKTQGVSTMTGTNGPHYNFKCEYCHRIEAGAASGDNAYGRLTYKGDNASRMLIVTLTDMEGGNVPISMNAGDTSTTVKTEPTISGNAMGKFNLSACVNTKDNVAACSNASLVLTIAPPDMRPTATYDTTTHQPKDTNNVTANSGLDVSKIQFNITVNATTGKGTIGSEFLTGAGSKAVNPGQSYHAASLVSCMECHGGDEPMGHNTRIADGELNNGTIPCSNCHYGGSDIPGSNRWTALQAGGFGLTPLVGDTGATEAHNVFVKTPDTLTRFKNLTTGGASNGACVACHTHVAVDITYTKPTTYKFSADMTDGNNIFVGSFSTTGTAQSHS